MSADLTALRAWASTMARTADPADRALWGQIEREVGEHLDGGAGDAPDLFAASTENGDTK